MEPHQELKDAMLEAQVEASLQGHDIGAFERVRNGYQARCRVCGGTTWLNDKGVRYSLLEDVCEAG